MTHTTESNQPKLCLMRACMGVVFFLITTLAACLQSPSVQSGHPGTLDGEVYVPGGSDGRGGVRVELFFASPPAASDLAGGRPARLVHRRIAAATTGTDGRFSLDLGSFDLDQFDSTRTLLGIAVWSATHAGYLDYDDWTDEHAEELAAGDSPPLRVRLNPKAATVVVRAQTESGKPLPGVQLVCLPVWNSWGAIHRDQGQDAPEWDNFLREVGLLRETDESGICVFTNLPLIDSLDTVFNISPSTLEYFSLYDCFDGWPENEPYVGVLIVEAVVDMSISGVAISASGQGVEGAAIWVNGARVGTTSAGGRWSLSGQLLGAPPWNLKIEKQGVGEATSVIVAENYMRATPEERSEVQIPLSPRGPEANPWDTDS